MSMADRPQRPARGKLSPPPTANVDPIDSRPATPEPEPSRPATVRPDAPNEGKGAAAPAAAPTTAPQASAPAPSVGARRSVTVQSGVNWSLETEELVAAVKARTGKTRRAIVEAAIARTWGI